MDDVNVERLGRLARMLRVRQRITQSMLARRAGVSRRAVSLMECGHADRLHLSAILAIAAGLGARLDMRLLWNGPELDRLLDARHAALAQAVKVLLERAGWIARVEVSFNRYGDRGRIDLLGWHPGTRILLVLEIKTELVDVQALLGSLDVKVRVGPAVAERFGWEVSSAVPAIVFAEDRTTRHRLISLASLFDRFELRGRRATAWVRHPIGTPGGLLWLTAAGRAEPGGTRPWSVRVRASGQRPVRDSPPAASTGIRRQHSR
jgi:transcriptional regulator with XRE-family HTH domain